MTGSVLPRKAVLLVRWSSSFEVPLSSRTCDRSRNGLLSVELVVILLEWKRHAGYIVPEFEDVFPLLG